MVRVRAWSGSVLHITAVAFQKKNTKIMTWKGPIFRILPVTKTVRSQNPPAINPMNLLDVPRPGKTTKVAQGTMRIVNNDSQYAIVRILIIFGDTELESLPTYYVNSKPFLTNSAEWLV